MYVLNQFPNGRHKFRIELDGTGKFWQLLDNSGGIIAEADSWIRLKTWAEHKRLKFFVYRW